MSAGFSVDRRVFVAGCVSAAGCWLLPSALAADGSHRPSITSVIINPAIPTAATFGAALSDRGVRCHPVHGDCYRFVRSVLNAGEMPETLAGMGTYADFTLVTGVLREARYDLVSQGLHPLSGPADHRCFGEWAGFETALRHSGSAWPATLANWSMAHRQNPNHAKPSTADCVADQGVVLSWVVRSKFPGRLI